MILVAGEALVDLVVDVDGTVTAALGGAPFNAARACARLGAATSFCGPVSLDRFGAMLTAQLEHDGVDTDRLVRVQHPTTLALAALDGRGTATYQFYVDGTSVPAMTDVPDGPAPELLFVGGVGLILEPTAAAIDAFVAATAPSTPLVMVDVNCRPLLVDDRSAYLERVGRVVAHADVVKVSDEDLAYMVPNTELDRAARGLLDRGPRAVLLTAGGAAVRVFTEHGATSVQVPPVDVLDTIGAGDAFAGGFAAWWVSTGRSADDLASFDHVVPAVRAANVVAGTACRRRGADPPWLADLPQDWASES